MRHGPHAQPEHIEINESIRTKTLFFCLFFCFPRFFTPFCSVTLAARGTSFPLPRECETGRGKIFCPPLFCTFLPARPTAPLRIAIHSIRNPLARRVLPSPQTLFHSQSLKFRSRSLLNSALTKRGGANVEEFNKMDMLRDLPLVLSVKILEGLDDCSLLAVVSTCRTWRGLFTLPWKARSTSSPFRRFVINLEFDYCPFPHLDSSFQAFLWFYTLPSRLVNSKWRSTSIDRRFNPKGDVCGYPMEISGVERKSSSLISCNGTGVFPAQFQWPQPIHFTLELEWEPWISPACKGIINWSGHGESLLNLSWVPGRKCSLRGFWISHANLTQEQIRDWRKLNESNSHGEHTFDCV